MKLVCSKSELQKGVNIVSKAVPVRTTMSILECILIDATTDVIKLIANDMELGIETKIEGTIEEKGMVAIDARIFSDIVRKLPDSDVHIFTERTFGSEADTIQTMIRCGQANFNIASKSGDEFSFLPYVERNDSITLSEFTLKEMVRQTIFSIAQNDTNPILKGELFEISSDGRFRVVSLDSHRISVRRTELKETYQPMKVIVPGKTLIEITKILSGEADKNVDIFFSSNYILFEFENTIVLSRLIEGNYFAIDTMLSHDYELKFTLNKRDLTDSIERSMLLIKEGEKKPIILDITDGNMNLSVKSQFGEMKEDILIDKEGRDLMIGFNPRFLLEALRVIDEESVTFYMTNSKSPCYIKDENESYIYLILPVNIVGGR